MIEKLSKTIVTQWVKYKIVPSEAKASYYFGTQLLISTTLNFLLAIIISISIAEPCYWLMFLLGFIPLRLSAGGYHAKSHSLCIIYFCLAFGLFGLISKLILLSKTGTIVYTLCSATFSFLIVYWLSPISSPNKKLTIKQRNRNRAICIILSVINWIFSVTILHWFDTVPKNLIFYLSGELLATVSIIFQVLFSSHS